MAPMGNRGHPHGHVELFQSHMAMGFAEGRLGLHIFGVDIALDDDLRLGGHHEIDGTGLHHGDGRAGETASHGHLVHAHGQLLRAHEGHIGRAAQHDGAGHFLVAALLVLAIVLIAASAAHPRRHAHHQPVARLQRGAIGAHVLHARHGVPRHHIGGGEGGGAVEARRRDGDGQHVQPLALADEVAALVDHGMARRVGDHARRDGVGDGVVPFGLDLIHRRLHADGIDFAIGGDGADHHGHVVFAAQTIHDIGEQEGLALGLVDAAHELPAHQRM